MGLSTLLAREAGRRGADVPVTRCGGRSTAAAYCTEPAYDPPTMPMRDGVGLATDVYLPPGGGSFATVLIRTPYDKRLLESQGLEYRRHGFAVAIQDVRRRWQSGGTWQPFLNEGKDGYDTIEWLAAQPWSNGRVGASELQEKLAASIADDWSQRLDLLPVADLDLSVVGTEVPYWRQWIEHHTDDDYWRPVHYLEDLASLDIPVLIQSGWFDGGTRGARLAFERLQEGGNRDSRLIVGPWIHSDRAARYVGGTDMGPAAEVDLPGIYRLWLDHWLRERGEGLTHEQPVQLYLMGANRWLRDSRYPLPETTVGPWRRAPETSLLPQTLVEDPSNPAVILAIGALSVFTSPRPTSISNVVSSRDRSRRRVREPGRGSELA